MRTTPALTQRIKAGLLRLHRDQQGDVAIEKLLILAAIALPLLAVLLFFGGDLKEWLAGLWSDVKSDSESMGGSDPF